VSLMPAVGEAMGCRQGAQQAEELRAVGRHLADGRRLRSQAHTRGGRGEGGVATERPKYLTAFLGLISHNIMISIHRWAMEAPAPAPPQHPARPRRSTLRREEVR